MPAPAKRGKGEHIIPECIHGSLTIRDVCVSCNSKLGREVDYRIIEDTRVINAILKLDLPKLKEKIFRNGSAIAEDIETGKEVPLKRVDGAFKLKAHQDSDGSRNYSDTDFLKYLPKMISKITGDGIEKVKRLVENEVLPAYYASRHGELIEIANSGIALRKKKMHKLNVEFKSSKDACTRVIAKIVYEFCWYSLGLENIRLLHDDLQYFGRLAMGEVEYIPNKIFYRDSDEKRLPDYVHIITVHYYENYIILDIDLFNSVNYRCLLSGDSELHRMNHPDTGMILIGSAIAMEFKPGKSVRKFMALLSEGETQWEDYIVPI